MVNVTKYAMRGCYGIVLKEVDELQIPIPINIQSYHVFFCVWVVNVGGPDMFSAGVWMSRE